MTKGLVSISMSFSKLSWMILRIMESPRTEPMAATTVTRRGE